MVQELIHQSAGIVTILMFPQRGGEHPALQKMADNWAASNLTLMVKHGGFPMRKWSFFHKGTDSSIQNHP